MRAWLERLLPPLVVAALLGVGSAWVTLRMDHAHLGAIDAQLVRIEAHLEATDARVERCRETTIRLEERLR
jgi:hypothetical protein